MNKETKIQLVIIFILTCILILLVNIVEKKDNKVQNFMPMEEEVEKETSKEDVEDGKNVTTKNINLNDYNSNINIKNGGEYYIEGEFNYSIIVDSKEKVTLNLNNVTINSTITAAIANINTNDLVINIPKNTTNILKDGGSSEYDGCIFSSGHLIIKGDGELKVYGNQEEGEGISTDGSNITFNGGIIYIESNDDGINSGGDGGTITINDGEITVKANGDGIDSNKDLIINGGYLYSMGSSIGGDAGIDTDGKFQINGGEVIALGSDMIQNPDNNSKQKYISFNLNSKINSNSKIILKNSSGKEFASFTAKEGFKTLIISNPKLKTDIYYLYIDGEKTNYEAIIK